MAVVKKTVAKKAAPRRARSSQAPNASVGANTDPTYVRHQALGYALQYMSPEGLTASKLITQAARLESYMLNGKGSAADED